MSQQLCRILQGHLSLKRAEAIMAGQEPSAWVFSRPEGQPIAPGANKTAVRQRDDATGRHLYATGSPAADRAAQEVRA